MAPVPKQSKGRQTLLGTTHPNRTGLCPQLGKSVKMAILLTSKSTSGGLFLLFLRDIYLMFHLLMRSLVDSFSFLHLFIYLFIYFREGKTGRKRGRETSMCACLSHVPNWRRHVP